MGVSAGHRRGCRSLLRRIRDTVEAVVAARPDVLVIIDSPDFTHRVARARAPAAARHAGRRLCQPERLGVAARPRAGHARAMSTMCWRCCRSSRHAHRAARRPALHLCRPSADRAAGGLRPDAAEQAAPRRVAARGARAARLAPLGDPAAAADFGAARRARGGRGGPVDFVLPAVAHLADEIRRPSRAGRCGRASSLGEAAKLAAFRRARAALAASGTVTLELALAGVPMVGRLQGLAARKSMLKHLIKVPSIVLPNLDPRRECDPGIPAAALHPDAPGRRRMAPLVRGERGRGGAAGTRSATPRRLHAAADGDAPRSEMQRRRIVLDAWPAPARTEGRARRAAVAKDRSACARAAHVVARERRARIELARTADLLARILDHLLPLRDPADRAGDREQHREHRGREAHRLERDARIEVDVRDRASSR